MKDLIGDSDWRPCNCILFSILFFCIAFPPRSGFFNFIMSNTSQLLVGGDDVNAVVIDYGSSSIRYGHAGEDAPTLVIPTTIGVIEEVLRAAGVIVVL